MTFTFWLLAGTLTRLTWGTTRSTMGGETSGPFRSSTSRRGTPADTSVRSTLSQSEAFSFNSKWQVRRKPCDHNPLLFEEDRPFWICMQSCLSSTRPQVLQNWLLFSNMYLKELSEGIIILKVFPLWTPPFLAHQKVEERGNTHVKDLLKTDKKLIRKLHRQWLVEPPV